MELNKDWMTARNVSSNTLILLINLIKVELKVIKNTLLRRKTNQLYKYKQKNKNFNSCESRQIKLMKLLNANNEKYLNYGSFMPHFIMNRKYGMDVVSDLNPRGQPIKYAKTKNI